MNYYEELGLTPAAADEDIRKAHRTLSKVLHPDRQNDPAARDAAEIQMRRINVIVDTLLDPQHRRDYDASLREEPMVFLPPNARVAPLRPRVVGPVGTLVLTVCAALVLTGAAAWFLVGDFIHFDTPGSRPAITPQASLPATPPAAPRNTAAARPTKPVVPPPFERVVPRIAPEHVDIPAEPPPSPLTTPSPAEPRPSESAPIATPAPAPAVITATPPKDTLDGLWLYASNSPKTGQTKLYSPEYIQLRIRAEDAVMHGEYSARYYVPDRAISAAVAFRFDGKPGGARSFEWQSDDGSRGVVDLKVLGEESLQVNWRVSHFGGRIGLGAGTAILIRKIDSW
jgi:hypothetical protein